MEVDGSCGANDVGDDLLWGPAALARAKAATRDATVPVEGETGLLRKMRKKVGPYAAEGKLVAHLRSSRGKLHWAVNGYFREAVLERAPAAGRADFEPRPVARPPQEASSCVPATTAGTATVADGVPCPDREELVLPPLVWEMLLARMPPADVCRLAPTCAAARDAARSDAVWRRQYEARWGVTAAARVASRHRPPPPSFAKHASTQAESHTEVSGGGGGARDERSRGETFEGSKRVKERDPVDSGGGARVNWNAGYRRRAALERRMTCPECLSSKVLPVVYGFPSPPLVAALKKSRVLLGGDYLVEGDPIWACGTCQSRWRAWPFAWPHLAEEDRAWAGVADHPGTTASGPRGVDADLDDPQPLPAWERTDNPPFTTHVPG